MTFFHKPVGLVELLILYARVQFYTPPASDYRLISKTTGYQSTPTFSAKRRKVVRRKQCANSSKTPHAQKSGSKGG